MSDSEEIKSEPVLMRRILSIPDMEEKDNDMETHGETVSMMHSESEPVVENIKEEVKEEEVKENEVKENEVSQPILVEKEKVSEQNNKSLKRNFSDILDNIIENITQKKVKVNNTPDAISLTVEQPEISSFEVKIEKKSLDLNLEIKPNRSIFSRVIPFLCSCNIHDVVDYEKMESPVDKKEEENKESLPGVTLDNTSV